MFDELRGVILRGLDNDHQRPEEENQPILAPAALHENVDVHGRTFDFLTGLSGSVVKNDLN